MSVIRFKSKIIMIDSWTLLVLPKDVSIQLPSRGMTMVKGTISNCPFQTALEPDGQGSHWLKIDKIMLKAIKATVGDTVELTIESTKEWPEPEVPDDLKKALARDTQVQTLWTNITPMARWDWIRWIRATNRVETRTHRIEVAFSKLKSGERRPCCFNRTMCTEPAVSKNGVLLQPA